MQASHCSTPADLMDLGSRFMLLSGTDVLSHSL